MLPKKWSRLSPEVARWKPLCRKMHLSCRPPQNPVAWTLARASSLRLAEAMASSSSDNKGGSTATLWQTSFSQSAVKSQSSLWPRKDKPSCLHIIVWSTQKEELQTQWLGTSYNCQPNLRLRKIQSLENLYVLATTCIHYSYFQKGIHLACNADKVHKIYNTVKSSIVNAAKQYTGTAIIVHTRDPCQIVLSNLSHTN